VNQSIPIPARIARLPVCPVRQVPVPWFVAWIDGKPEFRMAHGAKRATALNQNRCWVCGSNLGGERVFVAGPMCVVNRVSAEPPVHLECGEYSARACPFLSKPHMVRREAGRPEGNDPPGHMIARNPGCVAVVHSLGFRLVPDGKGQQLIDMGTFARVDWWDEGRPATRDEVLAAVEGGLPALHALAVKQGPAAEKELGRMVMAAEQWWPTEAA